MVGNNDKMDLRCIKTEKALDYAMYALLEKRNFRKITVNDICTAAMISRATFYARYTDKYDFLKNWLERLNPKKLTCGESYEYIEKVINKFTLENKAVIKNIVNNADQGTQDILFQIVLVFLNLSAGSVETDTDSKQIIFNNIYAGGVVNYIFWQVKNNFPPEVMPMNEHLYKIIEKCQNFEPE